MELILKPITRWGDACSGQAGRHAEPRVRLLRGARREPGNPGRRQRPVGLLPSAGWTCRGGMGPVPLQTCSRGALDRLGRIAEGYVAAGEGRMIGTGARGRLAAQEPRTTGDAGARSAEISRMSSAFEHDDLKRALVL